mgnify:CR=1 FL=1|jgi:hypothetical protein
MSRELTSHKVNGLNEAITIDVIDQPGGGGACHHYVVDLVGIPQTTITFQNGPLDEVDANGLSNESLLAIVEDRLQGFQNGPYACRENAIALTKLQEAMMWLHKRTRDRMARGVEGTHEV